MSERITTERAREIAGRDHGAHCRHCADSIALAADLLDARASLAAERTRREAAEARLAAIVASTARDLDALRAVRHLDEEHGREIAEAIDRAEDGGSHALHLVAALGRAAELRGMLRAVAAAVGCESWHDAATVAADTRARLAAIVGAVRTEREARDAVPEGFDADHAGADERARDALRVNRGTVDRILSAWTIIARAHQIDPSPANAERIATLATCAAAVRDEAIATRDAAVANAIAADARHAALAGAVESVRAAVATVAAAGARYGAAWDAVDAMPPTASQSEGIAEALRVSYEAQEVLGAAVDALLRGAPGGYVAAAKVRVYLDALDVLPGNLATINAACERERAARTALDAALAAATTTPEESL